MSVQQNTGRPVEVAELFRRQHLVPTEPLEVHSNAGFCGIMAGERRLFASLGEVSLGEDAVFCKATNGLPATLAYITRLEEQVERLTKERDLLLNLARTAAECPLCAGTRTCGDDCPQDEVNQELMGAINHARVTLLSLERLNKEDKPGG